MGHDISGYLRGDRGSSNEIAYLRRSAGNPLNGTIYKALQCPEHNCGCSGCGNESEFTHEQLTAALGRIPAGDEYEPERDFLRKCIATRDGIRIKFY